MRNFIRTAVALGTLVSGGPARADEVSDLPLFENDAEHHIVTPNNGHEENILVDPATPFALRSERPWWEHTPKDDDKARKAELDRRRMAHAVRHAALYVLKFGKPPEHDGSNASLQERELELPGPNGSTYNVTVVNNSDQVVIGRQYSPCRTPGDKRSAAFSRDDLDSFIRPVDAMTIWREPQNGGTRGRVALMYDEGLYGELACAGEIAAGKTAGETIEKLQNQSRAATRMQKEYREVINAVLAFGKAKDAEKAKPQAPTTPDGGAPDGGN